MKADCERPHVVVNRWEFNPACGHTHRQGESCRQFFCCGVPIHLHPQFPKWSNHPFAGPISRASSLADFEPL